jgi:uncharacterized protein YrrD
MRFSRDVTGIPVIHAESGKELGRVREWLLDSKGDLYWHLWLKAWGGCHRQKLSPSARWWESVKTQCLLLTMKRNRRRSWISGRGIPQCPG